jgi:F1F0 ATPase subunit 2
MSEPVALFFALFAGVLLGTMFFGGLWWTIRKGFTSTRPAVWLLASLLVRMAAALAGFYFVSRGDWRRLLSCLLGFLIARVVVTRVAREPIEKGIPAVGGRLP